MKTRLVINNIGTLSNANAIATILEKFGYYTTDKSVIGNAVFPGHGLYVYTMKALGKQVGFTSDSLATNEHGSILLLDAKEEFFLLNLIDWLTSEFRKEFVTTQAISFTKDKNGFYNDVSGIILTKDDLTKMLAELQAS